MMANNKGNTKHNEDDTDAMVGEDIDPMGLES
jgi:hypothetical protein